MTEILDTKNPTYWSDDLVPKMCKCHHTWVGACSCYRRWMSQHLDLRAIEIRSLRMKERDKIVGRMVPVHH